MDPPEMILNGALEGHYKMIKQMKGVPGVLPERYAEGFKVISSWASVPNVIFLQAPESSG